MGRVTGGNPSRIFGTIRTTDFGTANLFLINPSGWIFGASASLDVRGSFYASTADYLKFSDGAKFFADPAQNSGLTTAAPAAFGFLGPPDKLGPPATISVDGATLAVDPGQTLSLVGGDVTIRASEDLPGILLAPGGAVQIGSVASAGEAVLLTPDGAPTFDLGSFSSLGKVEISGGGGISVSGPDFGLPGGKVVIRSGKLIVDGAVIVNDTGDFAGAPLVGIDLGATESIDLRNGALVQTSSLAADASGISIATTGKLTVTDAFIESLAVDGRTGAIDIHAGSAEITNGVIRTASSVGPAGDITIVGAPAGSFSLSGPTGEISTQTESSDPTILAGNISLTDFGNVILGDQATIRSGFLFGQGGENLTVKAGDSIAISGLAGISSQSFSADVGLIDISAPLVTLDGGFINTSTLGTGNAGRVLVTADTVSLTNGAQIASSSQLSATGSGGNITINAPGAVTISGTDPNVGVGNITFTLDPSSGIFSTASGTGNAGQIAVSTPTLTMADNGKISVATSGAGSAGSVSLNVSNFTQTGGAQVVSSTTGEGVGGTLALTAGELVSISGAGSGLFSTASSTGNAGQITVSTPQLTMAENATISVATAGSGNAGNVSVVVGSLTQTGGAQVVSSTTGEGAGGTLAVTASELVSISGTGSGLFSTACLAACWSA